MKDFRRQRCYAGCRTCTRNAMSNPPDPLDPLLDRWTEPVDPAPNLAHEVWRRIAQVEGSRREGIWTEMFAWLSRPPFAVMFVASCALLGLFLAEVRVNREQRAHSSQLARSYLQLIDPLLKAGSVSKLP
jgi:hypothetical protein